MRILLTGANGQVGWELSNRGAKRGLEILALDRSALDITDTISVSREVNRLKTVADALAWIFHESLAATTDMAVLLSEL